MPNLRNSQAQKKLLTSDAWRTLADGARYRIDYLTRNQQARYLELRSLWAAGDVPESSEHYFNFFLCAAVKEVEGFTFSDPAKPDAQPQQATLEFRNGLVTDLVAGDVRMDFIDYCNAAGIFSGMLDTALSALDFEERDKKK